MTPTDIEKLKELATEADKPMEAYTSSGRERIREAALKFHAALKPSVFLAALSAKDAEIEAKDAVIVHANAMQRQTADDRDLHFRRAEAAEAALKEAREAVIEECRKAVENSPFEAPSYAEAETLRDADRALRALLSKQDSGKDSQR